MEDLLGCSEKTVSGSITLHVGNGATTFLILYPIMTMIIIIINISDWD